MANTYKNILIVPNIGAATGTDPYISFRGGNATVNTEITLKVYPDSNGTISFEGNTGQLFSITNDLTGSIFSVNDISGIPSIDVNANGEVRLAQFDGNVLIGNTNTDGSALLTMNGAANIASLRIRTYGEVINSSGVWTGPVIPAGKANVSVYADSGSTVTASGLNFVNTATASIAVTSGSSGNANVAITTNTALIFAQDDTSSTLLYPVMVSAAGSDQIAKVRTTAPDLDFNAATGTLSSNNITTNILATANTYASKQSSPTISAGTLTLDLNNATVFEVSLNENITTLTINNIRATGTTSSFVLVLIADGTARSVTWPISFKWPSGTAPTLTSTNNKRDVFVVFTHDGGTTWHAFTSGQNL